MGFWGFGVSFNLGESAHNYAFELLVEARYELFGIYYALRID